MTQFQGEYTTLLLILDGLFILVPLIIGVFWGAPLIAREHEAGTHRLVWNQSVTRRRWLTVKLLFVGLASMIVAGVTSLLLTWAASPVDQVADDRFGTIVFGARNIAPIAYAALAFGLGTVIGMLVRHTVPAMALTILAFVIIQFVMPNMVRPHLMAPVSISKPMTADAINQARGLGTLGNGAVVRGLSIPNAWISNTSELLTANGRPLDAGTFNDCLMNPPKTGATGTFGDAAQCLGALNLHITMSYQPNDRYWPFQWIESAIYLALSILLAAFGLWRVQRRLS
jgi:ABC-type transport system involved in multi-copper enzyme maturation permease subunit